MRTPAAILVILVIATIAQIVHFYPHLPDVAVSHWGSGGKPDGWLERTQLIWALVISELGTTGAFVAIALAFPRFPTRWINLPNRDYWFAPERRAQSLLVAQRHMLWGAVIIQVSMMLLWQTTINANIALNLQIPVSFWWTLGITAVVFVVWVSRLLQSFSSPPPTLRD